MSDTPTPGIPEGEDPEAALLRFLAQFGITPGADGRLDLEAVMARMQSMMTTFTTQLAGYGPTDRSGMNWGFTRDVTNRTAAAAGPDPAPTQEQISAIRDAAALADLWLSEEISFDALSQAPSAWSRATWVERTFETWKRLTNPVVTQLSGALAHLVERGQPAEAGNAMMQPMISMAASGMFAGQIGQAIGQLATMAVSNGDIGLPLTPARVALVPANVKAFAQGLDLPASDVMLFLCLREVARQRLFSAVGWLGPQLIALVEHYARQIRIDPDALEEAIEAQLGGALTAGDLEEAGQAVAGTLFSPQVSAEQHEILERLETLLALVEGWVDHVVEQVTTGRMPAALALTEALRRRRATGGPQEAALKALVGLELRPRRAREAATLWAATKARRGAAGRDAVWAHPDLMPVSGHLLDPLGFADADRTISEPDDMDAELARLLEEEGGA